MTLMLVGDAARVAQVPERTLRRWIDAGDLAAPRIGGARHVNPAQVEPLAIAWHENRGKRRARPALLA